MAEVLKSFEEKIDSFTLIPSDGGRFEVTLNNSLVYSKLHTNRHVEPGEINGLVQEYLEKD